MFLAKGLGRFGAEFFVLRPVTEEKTVDNCFFKDVTETRRNEVRLCRAHISPMFQEVEAYFHTSEGENGKNKQKLIQMEKTEGFQP